MSVVVVDEVLESGWLVDWVLGGQVRSGQQLESILEQVVVKILVDLE